MYVPNSFREERLDVMHELIRRHPLGLLVTSGAGGLLADPIPFLLQEQGENGTLLAHLARANPQVEALRSAEECLVAFQGPQAYITPSWYETKRETGKVVPTWNYATVQAWGRPKLIEDPDWLLRHVGEMTDQHEGKRPEPWALSDAPEEFLRALTRGIIGVEIPIIRIQGKWKVSQNRSAADQMGVVAGLLEQGGEREGMARLVQERSHSG
jgi:transcriptional regulator